MFTKVLIANRGEIAVRIARTLQQMGIAAVAVYSDPDRAAPHVAAADEAYPLGGTTSAETYLQAAKIIEIARRHGVDAIHPGYGFLAENADFADACEQAGIIFVGPRADVIRAMGDKVNARNAFAAAGAPVVPGWSGEGDVGGVRKAAANIGFPVLIKAVAGGGGKGMRVVEHEREIEAAVEAAMREAGAAFGDARVFLEKYLERPRHVEVQILGDAGGSVVHLYERECSVQRRHQKIVEETPSPGLDAALRRRICETAVRAAKAVGYTNAGTVEFLVTDSGEFQFLEVNTRLQVEHPVTEMTVHHDLVRAQVLVAAGRPLPFSQDDLQPVGHAIEARVYAEDPDRGFLPSTGTIGAHVAPSGPNIRVDSGVTEGTAVSPYYDPMLSKVIAWGRDRDEAIDRMRWALRQYVILGVTTNLEFLQRVLDDAEFRAGRVHTQWLAESALPAPPRAVSDEAWIVAALAVTGSPARAHSSAGSTPLEAGSHAPWRTAERWRAF